MNGNFSIECGLPPHEFFPKAWASEPLTGVLKDTNIPFALAFPDEDVSLVAKQDNEVIGQCSANRVVKYWTHLDTIDTSMQNLSTQIFISIHKKAVLAERNYLAQLGLPEANILHTAGIAVLPEHRGRHVAMNMREQQIALCKQKEISALFSETTNAFSAATVQKFGFTKIAEFPYPELAVELNHPQLSSLNDSFTVWCLRV